MLVQDHCLVKFLCEPKDLTAKTGDPLHLNEHLCRQCSFQRELEGDRADMRGRC